MTDSFLIYDGDCAFCNRAASVARRINAKSVTIAPYQSADLNGLGLTEVKCQSALQFVTNNGQIFSAEKAVASYLRTASLPWRAIGHLLLMPGIAQLSGLSYRWIARNRFRLPGGAPSCELKL